MPQGSILGPLLFIIYINDLTNVPSSLQPFLFADDSKFLARLSSESDYPAIQHDLNLLSEWKNSSRLDFNLTKTFIIHFSHNSPLKDCHYLFNGIPVPTKTCCKDLGVHFSSDLSWCSHYSAISQKVYGILSLLRRSFSVNIPVICKQKLYTSLIIPHLTYCSPVWRPYLIKDIKTLEKVQRRATKFILNYYDLQL